MGKDKDSETKEPDQMDKKGGQEEKEEVHKGPVYTGEGFIPIEILVDNVKAWQQRKILCEDIDYLERHGGRRTND